METPKHICVCVCVYRQRQYAYHAECSAFDEEKLYCMYVYDGLRIYDWLIIPQSREVDAFPA